MINIKRVFNMIGSVIVGAMLLSGCSPLKYDSSLEQTFDSPSGEHFVTVKVDYVSRPDVFYENQCIFKYEGSGFTEDIIWDVEWVSEDEIVLSPSPSREKYADEYYTIEIPGD